MKFNAILRQFEAALKSRYADQLLPSMFQAIHALLRCRTEAAGAMKLHCPDCNETSFDPVDIAVVPNVKTMKPHNG